MRRKCHRWDYKSPRTTGVENLSNLELFQELQIVLEEES